jgi:hypothetical protein
VLFRGHASDQFRTAKIVEVCLFIGEIDRQVGLEGMDQSRLAGLARPEEQEGAVARVSGAGICGGRGTCVHFAT